MDLVFRITNTTDPSVPPQVGDTNFQEHYSGVNRSMAWAELTPAIRQATEKFILPYVGTELYNDLVAKYTNDENLEDYQEQTLQYLRDAIAYYAIYHVLPEKNAAVSSLGVTTHTPTEGSAQPTTQWGWKALRWNALENGDMFLDRLLNYMESQVAAAVSYFDLWKNSSAYTKKTSDFFRSTDELDEYLNIQRSRRSFISLVRWMRQVEEDYILPLLCTDQYEALKEASTDDELKLLKKVRECVAYLGLAEAGPHHRLVIDGDGFRVVSQTDQFDDRRNMTNNVHEAAINSLLERSERRGRDCLAKIKIFLEKNEGLYPLWAASDCRVIATTKAHSIRATVDENGDYVGGIGIF